MADEWYPAIQAETVSENLGAVVTGCGGSCADYSRLVAAAMGELENYVFPASRKVINRNDTPEYSVTPSIKQKAAGR